MKIVVLDGYLVGVGGQDWSALSELGELVYHDLTTGADDVAGRIGDADIESSFRKTVLEAGALIDDKALADAVKAIDGFPYMMQLVGYWTWEETLGRSIKQADVKRGVTLAAQELRDGVLATTYRELSNGDVRFLEAMLLDEGASSLADISARMGVRSNYASKYKERLLATGVIGEAGRGHYAINLPGFKDYVREQANR